MALETKENDPLSFMRNLWSTMGFSLPGMVSPTLDTDDLTKQINDMRAVEGWLQMNLSMLQMTIQNMEMQRTTVSAVKTMSQFTANAIKGSDDEHAAAAQSGAPLPPMLFPWQLMHQVTEHMQQNAVAVADAAKKSAKRVVEAATAAEDVVKKAEEKEKEEKPATKHHKKEK